MNIKAIVIGSAGILTTGLALVFGQGFAGATQSGAAQTTATTPVAQGQSVAPTTSSGSATPTETNPNSATKYDLPINKRVEYADIAAKNAVGGGNVANLTAGTVQGQGVWKVTVAHQGQKTLVVLRQSNDSVVSKTRVG